MSLQHIKLKPLFYLRSKKTEAILKKISKLQQKWEQNSSPISCEQNKIERWKRRKTQELQSGAVT